MLYLQTPLFSPGSIVITRNASECLGQTEVQQSLQRHLAGDWGDLCKEDRLTNESALALGGRLLSVYKSAQDEPFWIITEADRSSTTILLPQDY